MEEKTPKTVVPVPARTYVEFSHTFIDPWGADGDETEVTLKFRFAKPNKMQIKRLQDTAGKNGSQAARNLILEVVHPDEKDGLTQALEDYPGLSATFSTAVIRGVGISQELGK